VVVPGAVEELTVVVVQPVVVLAVFDAEITDPAKLAVNVSLLGKLRVVGHSGSFDLVLLVWVQLPLGVNHDMVLVLECLVEVLL